MSWGLETGDLVGVCLLLGFALVMIGLVALRMWWPWSIGHPAASLYHKAAAIVFGSFLLLVLAVGGRAARADLKLLVGLLIVMVAISVYFGWVNPKAVTDVSERQLARSSAAVLVVVAGWLLVKDGFRLFVHPRAGLLIIVLCLAIYKGWFAKN